MQELSSLFNRGGTTNAALLQVGKVLWDVSYKETQDDGAALNKIVKHALNFLLDVKEKNPNSSDSLCCKSVLFWAARWVDQGAPRIVLDSKFAAFLIASDVNPEVLDLTPPWKAFTIDVPSDLFEIGKDVGSITSILVHQYYAEHANTPENKWTVLPRTDRGNLCQATIGMSIKDMCETSEDNEPSDGSLSEARTYMMINRLVASLLLALKDPTIMHEQKKSKGRAQRFRLNKDTLSPRTFVANKPTAINHRPEIVEYLNRTKSFWKNPEVAA